MSATYRPITWTRSKIAYDALLLAGVACYLAVYLKLGPVLFAEAGAVDTPILRMRAFGSCAFVLLSLVLAIGPLVRLEPRLLPLLYNRRHFGVVTACIAATHASAVLAWYYDFSPTPKFVALFTANPGVAHVRGFPFEWLGLAALLILAVMALTSHDFWLSFLTPRVWKLIHMSVYVAYALVVLHVALGALQTARDPLLLVLVTLSLAALIVLHLRAGLRERAEDVGRSEGLLDFGRVADLREGRAVVACTATGERIALFRFDDRLSALSNVCSHQNGPLGEGRIIDGLVTCPWHGFQYKLEDGCSPPPYRERVVTYRVSIVGEHAIVDPVPLPLGTRSEPVRIPPSLLVSRDTPVVAAEPQT